MSIEVAPDWGLSNARYPNLQSVTKVSLSSYSLLLISAKGLTARDTGEIVRGGKWLPFPYPVSVKEVTQGRRELLGNGNSQSLAPLLNMEP